VLQTGAREVGEIDDLALLLRTAGDGLLQHARERLGGDLQLLLQPLEQVLLRAEVGQVERQYVRVLQRAAALREGAVST
jgi:hypothetical protein